MSKLFGLPQLLSIVALFAVIVYLDTAHASSSTECVTTGNTTSCNTLQTTSPQNGYGGVNTTTCVSDDTGTTSCSTVN